MKSVPLNFKALVPRVNSHKKDEIHYFSHSNFDIVMKKKEMLSAGSPK